ncbi:hypothetical protein [Rhizobium sp. Leaf386]|uniref:hypothetical protein n=1 Tax=Rhizobium sp. Leaf386 TaxID=1736359 RepID=UPI0007122E98|nr:hypothetical protein [Rhizobium sp. Leaf386]KQT07001.1 hypothetical protein ASG50_00790 [Rhizobium sp. Leaf386]
MRFHVALLAFAVASSAPSIVCAQDQNVFLFLNEDTAETKIDGLNVTLRAELTDKDLKEREFMRTPRVWLSCYDGGRQVMTIDTADDLDPWPSVNQDRDVESDAALVSQTGSFSELHTRLRASRITHLMKISVDITGRAEDVARSWMQGFPIKLKATPGNGLQDLDLVIFPEARSPAFRTNAAALVQGCEVLKGG